ncbi:MAG: hypothetical protein AAB757_00935 [Patescibacteria group bacterium]
MENELKLNQDGINKKTIFMIIAVVVIIALGVGGYFYWKKTKTTSQEQILQTIGETGEILEKSAAQGVLPSINNPDVNPISKTNPFKDIKTNPFE